MAQALDWYEIPTLDLDRAIRFYGTVLDVRFTRELFGGVPMAMFPHEDKSTGGALIQDGRRKPSAEGALLYLNTHGHLDACVARVAKAGGTVLAAKVDIGDPGFIALIRDTEGNTIGLHQER